MHRRYDSTHGIMFADPPAMSTLPRPLLAEREAALRREAARSGLTGHPAARMRPVRAEDFLPDQGVWKLWRDDGGES